MEIWGSRAGTLACGASRIVRSYETSLILAAAGGASDGGDCDGSSGVFSLVYMLVGSSKR
jgi:hypothetical protein